jgi:hypothetical protein
MSEENDKTLWQKIKDLFQKYQNLIYSIIIVLILINIQNPQSIYTSFIQKGGNAENMVSDMGGMSKKSGIGSKLKGIKNANFFTTVMGWMLGLMKTFAMFGGLVIALAVLPALPLFIFMLILFFILRARMAFIKEL